jgi:archaemetzincin
MRVPLISTLVMLVYLVAPHFQAFCQDSGTQVKAANTISTKEIDDLMTAIKPLFAPIGKPGPSDWLANHAESGQTFSEYTKSNPFRPVKSNVTTIYVQPLGDFSNRQKKIIDLTTGFLEKYFGLPSAVHSPLPLSVIPGSARRVHPSWGDKQVLSTYVLDDVLKPKLPKDAAAYIAFTTSDLWPGQGWNFVFGQASLDDRVGVWSIYRNGNADGNDDEFRVCLRRTISTAAHETGHMFGMLHCIAYECLMCGSNHRAEADRRPLALCPECMAKLCWATGVRPTEHYRKLAAFCREHGLEKDRALFDKLLHALPAQDP